jgi:hypothetical protein
MIEKMEGSQPTLWRESASLFMSYFQIKLLG